MTAGAKIHSRDCATIAPLCQCRDSITKSPFGTIPLEIGFKSDQ